MVHAEGKAGGVGIVCFMVLVLLDTRHFYYIYRLAVVPVLFILYKMCLIEHRIQN